jgi:hypothetical protein
VSSYAPLLVVFAALDTLGKGWPSVMCLVVAAISVIGLVVFFLSARALAPIKIVVEHARHRDTDAISYVVTYLIPFAGFEAHTLRTRISLAIFLLIIGILYVRAHLFYVNPLLTVVGFRLFEVETDSGRILLVISRRKFIGARSNLSLCTLSDYVFLEDAHA